MNPERWRRIEQIYYAALELEPAQRETFLEQSCAGDPLLHSEVNRLLNDRAEAERFIESPAVEVAARALFGKDTGGSVEGRAIEPTDKASEKIKHHKHAPWWMYAIATAMLICAAVRYYNCFVQVDLTGLIGHPIHDGKGVRIGAAVESVLPDSEAERLGLAPGDQLYYTDSGRLSSVPGQPGSGDKYWTPGRTYRIEIERNGERRFTSFTFKRMPWSSWWKRPNYRVVIILLWASVLHFALALLIVFRRPYDPAARAAALFLATMASAMLYRINFTGIYGIILSLPRAIGWLVELWPKICEVCVLPAFITFASLFPSKLFNRSWIWALIWLPAVLLLPLAIFSAHPPIYSFPQWSPEWYLLLARGLTFAGWCALPIIVFLNYRGLRSFSERRRIRIVMAGAAITIVGFIPLIAAVIFPTWGFSLRLYSPPYYYLTVFHFLVIIFPIAMAYAILRHRVFDLRVIIRQGVRYAAARGMLLSLVPLIVIVFVGDLLLHRDQPLGEILRRRAAVYVALAIGALLLHRYRKKWLEALDRRFFRERYDAQRILRDVISEIREAKNYEKVAPRVTLQIEKALHPEFAAVLVRRPGEVKYRILAANENTPPPMNPSSKLMTLVRVLGKPVEISQSQTGWLWEQLPEEESEFLRRARLEWLFPVSLAEGQMEALLAVGPKRSEEPYSREDQELLQGITNSLGLLLEQSQDFISDSNGFKECPECGVCYDSDSDSCEKEGAVLSPLPFSRLLTGRYRFERRLGAGGMGMVYQALDTELERQVAVKLMHPELTSSANAAARFKEEAKAAASFTHPNVVTVYDYGVSENQRAYIIMELLRGSTLRQALNKRGRFSAGQASDVLSSVCMAVEAAHRKRLVHRDLKPENIFLAESESVETVKILDFGVVKKMAGAESSTVSVDGTSPGMLVGTLKYMSPEELRGANPSESWDLWALAVVAYELLAGTHPFARSTPLEARNAILDGQVSPLRTHLPEAPSSWQQFFVRALAFNPELRPKSALQFLSDFKQSIY